MKDHPAFTGVESSALTARLYEIRRQERTLLVEFLQILAEVEARSVHLELGFSSLFTFLTGHLGYTKGAAFRRSTAARMLARFPVAAEYLADGRLGLTTFVELRDVLEEARLVEILDRASGKSGEQVKELVAALAPRPPVPDLIRRLPEPRIDTAPDAPAAPAAPALRPARIEPISEELRVLRMTVGRAFVADLEAVRSALSHQIPDGGLEAVLHECMRRLLRDHARRRAAETNHPRRAAEPTTDTRDLPAAVRRAVWKRDEGCCAFIGSDGRRCASTHQLQFHHIVPFARGGAATVENIQLLCSRHNLHLAEKDFGAEHMAKARAAKPSHRDAGPAQLSLV